MFKGKRKSNDDNEISGRAKASNSHPTAKKASKPEANNNKSFYEDRTQFKHIVNKCGLKLSTSQETPSVLSTFSGNFLKTLAAELNPLDSDTASVIDEFVEGFRRYIQPKDRFQAALMPTEVTVDESSATFTDDSLIRMLMKIDSLQVLVITEVLEKFSELLQRSNAADIDLERLILNQFRFLENIVDGEVAAKLSLSTKFLKLIKIAKGEIQLEILACLPEIAEDSQHEGLAIQLDELMKNAKHLVVPMLDVIGKLSLRWDLLLTIRETTIANLNSYSLKDCPVALKFLLATSNDAKKVEELFDELAGSFDLRRIFDGKAKNAAESSGQVVFVLETALKYQKHFLDGVLHYLEKRASSSVQEANLLDFLSLLILLNTSKKKSASLMFKHFVRSGNFSEDFLKVSCQIPLILKRYFKTIYELCEILVRSLENVISKFGCCIYVLCFSELDVFYRQEIIGALITHVSSGSDTERSAALTTLQTLLKDKPEEVCEFSLFLKNLLDFLPLLSYSQARDVFSLLGQMAALDDSIFEELNMLFQKNISAVSFRQKGNGILCVAMLFKNFILRREKQKTAMELLQSALKSTSSSNIGRYILFDELAEILSGPDFENALNLRDLQRDVLKLFQTLYVCTDSREIRKFENNDQLKFGLSEDRNIAVRIAADSFHSKSSENEIEKSSYGLTLASIFRFLGISHLKLDNNLSALDDYLECSIVFVKDELLSNFKSETKENKDFVCKTMFYVINFFRELLNSFCQVKSFEVTEVLVRRLVSLVDLQNNLERNLLSLSSFQVPIPSYDLENPPILKMLSPTQKQVKIKMKTDKGRVMSKKRLNDETVVRETQLTTAENDTDEQQTGPGCSKSFVASKKPFACHDSGSIKRFYRELDLGVLRLLENDVSFTTPNDLGPLVLNVDVLVFLLEDLEKKLNCGVPSSVKRTTAFSKQKLPCRFLISMDEDTAIARFSEFIPTLFRHLKSCKDFLASGIDENDGVLDGASMFSKQYVQVAQCFDLIISCLNTIFNWHGLGKTEHTDQTKSVFKYLALVFPDNARSAAPTLNFIAGEAVKHFLDYFDVVASLFSASNLLMLLTRLSQFGAPMECKQKIFEIANNCLKREWSSSEGTPLKSAKAGVAIKSLLKIAMTNSEESPMNFIESMIQSALSEAAIDDNFCSESFKTLNKLSFGVWYGFLFTELVLASKKLDCISTNNSLEVSEEKFSGWVQAARQFNFLMSVLKKVEIRSVFISSLQQGNGFVRVFIDNCMTLLDYSLTDSHENVRRLLVLVQTGTRVLQTLCTHSKIVAKDKSLSRYVPALKKTLEEFVYRVKAMMVLNNCGTALSIGVLKSKNLQGEVILSQESTTEEDQSIADSVTTEKQLGDTNDDEEEADEYGNVNDNEKENDDEEVQDVDDDVEDIDLDGASAISDSY